jgi:hypothetical protein
MIKVELPTRTLGICFIYKDMMVPIIEGFKLSGPTHREERATKCEIVEVDPKIARKYTVLSDGLARCCYKDNFKKDIGRKIALSRAIKKLDFSKFERTMIWESYLNRAVEGTVLEIEKIMREEVEYIPETLQE